MDTSSDSAHCISVFRHVLICSSKALNKGVVCVCVVCCLDKSEEEPVYKGKERENKNNDLRWKEKESETNFVKKMKRAKERKREREQIANNVLYM